ncbi:hypothetical protein [Bradyrhizobium guangzhouense]|uniref:hypothetical protein n=1 Tax=Bradyrhizobium guangzhouense TaxID=1325095 RepID=UPI001008D326|nr:hypothetical protein [Bradyrhizobium guangzhouense]
MRWVIAAAGRRIDAPDARNSSFAVARIASVRRLILDYLLRREIEIIISSGACGADLLLLDAAEELSIQYRILLPSTIASFRTSSVIDCAPSRVWADIYDRVTSAAVRRNNLIENIGDDRGPDYAAVNAAILEQALLFAGGRASSAIALMIWDGRPHPNRRDLTAEFKAEAEAKGFCLEEISTT